MVPPSVARARRRASTAGPTSAKIRIRRAPDSPSAASPYRAARSPSAHLLARHRPPSHATGCLPARPLTPRLGSPEPRTAFFNRPRPRASSRRQASALSSAASHRSPTALWQVLQPPAARRRCSRRVPGHVRYLPDNFIAHSSGRRHKQRPRRVRAAGTDADRSPQNRAAAGLVCRAARRGSAHCGGVSGGGGSRGHHAGGRGIAEGRWPRAGAPLGLIGTEGNVIGGVLWS